MTPKTITTTTAMRKISQYSRPQYIAKAPFQSASIPHASPFDHGQKVKLSSTGSAIDRRCDNVLVRGSMVAGRRLAMNSVHHGWFSDNKEWIEFIAAVVVLWLAMTVITGFDLRSAG